MFVSDNDTGGVLNGVLDIENLLAGKPCFDRKMIFFSDISSDDRIIYFYKPPLLKK